MDDVKTRQPGNGDAAWHLTFPSELLLGENPVLASWRAEGQLGLCGRSGLGRALGATAAGSLGVSRGTPGWRRRSGGRQVVVNAGTISRDIVKPLIQKLHMRRSDRPLCEVIAKLAAHMFVPVMRAVLS